MLKVITLFQYNANQSLLRSSFILSGHLVIALVNLRLTQSVRLDFMNKDNNYVSYRAYHY